MTGYVAGEQVDVPKWNKYGLVVDNIEVRAACLARFLSLATPRNSSPPPSFVWNPLA